MAYTYLANSNKLMQVNDAANDASSKLGDFHYSGTKQATDYNYDGNGNLILDNNKAISAIAYNYLNLSNQISVTAKGSVNYSFDANGNKLSKTTIDNTVSPAKITTTKYIGSFVYQTDSISGGAVGIDTLQFISHEEGRARWAYHKYVGGTSAYGFEYDFFEKDHLGNTRVILTQEKDTAKYLASGEGAFRATENQLFSNLTTTTVARTGAQGYPVDITYTNPNDTVFKVSGDVGGHKIGPSLLLKVMSGDKFDITVQSYYVPSGPPPGPNSSITDVLASLASGLVNVAAGSKGSITDLNNTTTSPIFSALNSFASNDPSPGSSKPKAYLNWILLDDQLKYVSSYPQSNAALVGSPSVINTIGNTGIPITKNGFLYIWVSNETPGWSVYFDNLKVVQYTGPELEETHYYPFGLTMAGISSKALKSFYASNNYKYNGKELQNQEFGDGSGLEEYDYSARMYNPQIGKWLTIDPLSEKYRKWTPYNYGLNDPIRFVDPDGMGVNDHYYIDHSGNILAIVRNDESTDKFYEVSDDGKTVTNIAEVSKADNNSNAGNAWSRVDDNTKAGVIIYETQHPNSGTNGYGVMRNDPAQKIVPNESTTNNPKKIIGAVNGGKGTEIIRQDDKVNPHGANQDAVLSNNSKIPAPDGNQEKASLPSGSLPKNLPASRSNSEKVTDSNGNYIPAGKQKIKIKI